MRNIEEEEEEGSEVNEAKEDQAVFGPGGDGNVDTERDITRPRVEEQQDDDEEQAGLSDSELDLRNHLRDDILETVRFSSKQRFLLQRHDTNAPKPVVYTRDRGRSLT